MKSAGLLLLLASLLAHADEPARDPTALPPALRNALAPTAPGGEPYGQAIRQVVFVEGRGYVVQRGRRYGVGEQLDGARIERITEQAVWLREAGKVRREPLYGGVEKRPPPVAPDAQKSKEKP
ncbi:MAG TPA: hypothetical protein VGF12_19185 [Roseateles sp.]|uniref:hypothetical protein n=1 Tax=Roseateles sp. TaxID=1971397 RepID=UPI002ED8F7DA